MNVMQTILLTPALAEKLARAHRPVKRRGEQERRKRPRAALPDSLTVHVQGPGWRRSLEGFCRDIGGDGLGAFLRRPLTVPMIVELDLNLPEHIYTVHAQTVFCRPIPAGFHVGLRFLFPEPQPHADAAQPQRTPVAQQPCIV